MQVKCNPPLICPVCGHELIVEARTYNECTNSKSFDVYLDCWCDVCNIVEFSTNNIKDDNPDYMEKLIGQASKIIENAKSLKM